VQRRGLNKKGKRQRSCRNKSWQKLDKQKFRVNNKKKRRDRRMRSNKPKRRNRNLLRTSILKYLSWAGHA